MKIFQVSPENFKNNYLDQSITLLQKGEVIAFPTDTLYGVGVDYSNEDAVKKLYRVKSRPAELPLTLLGSDKDMIIPYVLDWNPLAEKLSEQFWPGALTIILKKSFKVPDFVVSGLDTVGIRVPEHPIILKILEEYGKPIATSSANLSGNASSTTGRYVAEELFDTELSLLLDSGKTPQEEQSTIIDLSGDTPIIIREGLIKEDALRSCLEGYI